MNIEETLVSIVEADITASGIFTHDGEMNFTPVMIDNQSLPYACYQIWDEQPNLIYKGRDGTNNVKVQISVYDTTYDGAKTGNDAIVNAIFAYIGTNTNLSITDSHRHTSFDTELKLYQNIADLYLLYFE